MIAGEKGSWGEGEKDGNTDLISEIVDLQSSAVVLPPISLPPSLRFRGTR